MMMENKIVFSRQDTIKPLDTENAKKKDDPIIITSKKKPLIPKNFAYKTLY